MRIVNLTTIIKAVIALTLFIHVITCGWILISLSNPQSWIYTKSLIPEIDLQYNESEITDQQAFNEYLTQEFGPS